MALPNWTIELLRRSLNEVAEKARQPETIEKLKSQANEILQDLPQTAARGLDAVLRGADAGRKSVERWTRKHTQLSVPMLNATGTLFSEHGTGVPLSPAVADVGREVGSGDCVLDSSLAQRLTKRLDRTIDSSGGQSIAIATSFEAAVAAISVFSATRTIAVHRSNCVRLPSSRPDQPGLSLPAALSTIGVALSGLPPTIMEVGSSNISDPSDFGAVERACVVVADGGDRPAEPFQLSDSDAIQIAVLPVATLNKVSGAACEIPSATDWLTKVDMIVMPGDGLCGGPTSGIIIGRRELLETITSSTAWSALGADLAKIAMVTVAMEIADSHDGLPSTKLMETSQENLKSRAERLAIRLSGQDSIASCQVTADDAKLTATGRWTLPSRQVCLRHVSKSAKAWAEELGDELPSVAVAAHEDFVKLDLRWIAASEDAKLAEIVGDSNGEPSDSGDQVSQQPEIQ